MGRVYRPIEIRVNGKSAKVVGIIDSGADETVISRRLAKQLNAKLQGKFEALSITKHKLIGKYAIIGITELRSGKSVKNYPVGVSDKAFDDDEGIEIIIGVDFLQDTNYALIFRK